MKRGEEIQVKRREVKWRREMEGTEKRREEERRDKSGGERGGGGEVEGMERELT